MKETYRNMLERKVREHEIRRLARLLVKFHKGDAVHREIKIDIRRRVLMDH